MTQNELFMKNQTLSHEFELYLLEHPEMAEKIPPNAQVILLPKDDPELLSANKKLAKQNQESRQPVVYVHVERLQPIRSRLVRPELEIVPQ
jgi:hypothetical protein